MLYVQLRFTDESQGYLESCARIRKISKGRLVQRLLDTVMKDQLVLAVLDDASCVTPLVGGEKNKSKCRKTHLFDGCT